MKFRRRPSATTRKTLLDMTPFVDTFLNLMIFFFVTASFTEAGLSPKLDVSLPKSSSSVLGKVREDLAIIVRRNGDMEVEGKVVDLATLEKRLVRYQKEEPQGGVLIQADEKVTHGRVVQVMGIVDKLKIHKLSIGVEESR